MAESEKKPNSSFKIVVLIAITIFSIYQLINTLNRSSKKAKQAKIVNAARIEADSLEQLTGIRFMKAGGVYIPPDESFMLPIMWDMNVIKTFIDDELMFIGLPASAMQEDSAGLMVLKVPADTTLSLIDNWNNHQSEKLKKNPASFIDILDGEVTFKDEYCVFNFKSEKGLSGVIRLEKRASKLYIVRAGSSSKKWDSYKGAFTFSTENFRIKE